MTWYVDALRIVTLASPESATNTCPEMGSAAIPIGLAPTSTVPTTWSELPETTETLLEPLFATYRSPVVASNVIPAGDAPTETEATGTESFPSRTLTLSDPLLVTKISPLAASKATPKGAAPTGTTSVTVGRPVSDDVKFPGTMSTLDGASGT